MTLTAQPLALVTGAARGIGRRSPRLQRDGFEVIILDREPLPPKPPRTRYGQRRRTRCRVDLLDKTAAPALVACEGPLDALVNNAGIFDERKFFELTVEDFRRMYDVNLVAMFALSQAAAGRMKPNAKIVNIASRAFLGARNHAHYVASKAAVVGSPAPWRWNSRLRGILVNAVTPGLIDTPMLQALTPERLAAQFALQPTGKAGRPEDIANAVAFLAAPTTHFLTGQVLFVDGGKTLGGGMGI